MNRRAMLRRRARERKEAEDARLSGSMAGLSLKYVMKASKEVRLTGIRSWDGLLRLKSNRVPVVLRNGRQTWAAPGQYIKGVIGVGREL